MNENNVTLSIVTITFNDLNGLVDTVASVDAVFEKTSRRQSFQHVIVDGGSTDGTPSYLVQLRGAHRVSTVVISEPDDGVYDAMNKGVRLASGVFVLFLNSGDMFHDGVLLDEVLAECNSSSLIEREAGMAYSSRVRSGPLESLVIPRNVSETMPRMPTIHQSMLYKRVILLHIPYHMDCKVCGDFDNFARILKAGYYFRPVECILSVFYVGGLSSQSPLRLFRESVGITRKYFPASCAMRFSQTARLLISLTLFQVFFCLGRFLQWVKLVSSAC